MTRLLLALHILYLYHLTIIRLGLDYPDEIRNYLGDLLGLPIMLSWVTIIIQQVRKNHNFRLKAEMILACFIYISWCFEYLLPLNNQRFTADKLDICCYMLGAFFYYFYQEKFINNTHSRSWN